MLDTTTPGRGLRGALALIGLLAVGPALLVGCGDDEAIDPQPTVTVTEQTQPSSEATADPTTDPTADAVDDGAPPTPLTVEDLPDRQRLGAWEKVDVAEPALACFPGDFDEPSAAAAFKAPIAGAPGSSGAGVRAVVYQFDDKDSADGAYADVATALRTCGESKGFSGGQAGDASDLGTDRAEYRLYTYGDPAICTDCDGVWFDRMGVAQVADRVVLVSFREAGGPLQPKGLDVEMRAILEQAVANL